MDSKKPYLFDLDEPELAELVSSWGEPAYRARQIWTGLYTELWSDLSEYTTLPKAFRAFVQENADYSRIRSERETVSADGQTTKNLLRLPAGESIEAVWMRYDRRDTLCISTQAGCALGCVFCATGQMGLMRNLSSGEIVEQVVFFARQMKSAGRRPTNIVLMGMGEPFHNYSAVMAAIERLNHPEGMNLGARRFTISTVGLIPGIERFTAENRQVNLAISLHAADDELRSSLLPINRKYPLAELMKACRAYVQQTGRRISFEWALIQDVNDGPLHAYRLAGLLKGLNCHVNLIPLNPTRGYAGKASPRQRAREFCQIMTNAQFPCTIRLRRGIDIDAGCGQLASGSSPLSPPPERLQVQG